MLGCFGFNGSLRQYFSLYWAVSQREGERGKSIDESKNVQTTPSRTYCEHSRPLPYSIQIVGRPGTGSLPSTIVTIIKGMLHQNTQKKRKQLVLHVHVAYCFNLVHIATNFRHDFPYNYLAVVRTRRPFNINQINVPVTPKLRESKQPYMYM